MSKLTVHQETIVAVRMLINAFTGPDHKPTDEYGRGYEAALMDVEAVLDKYQGQRDSPTEPFCDQCAGPYDGWLAEQYGGHWDTCINRYETGK